MKKIIFIFLILFSPCCLAEDWVDHLILSSEAYDAQAYDIAINHIDLALTNAPDTEIPRLKIQKAMFLNGASKYKEALSCVEELECFTKGNLSIKQQVECAEIKTYSYVKLQDLESAKQYFYKLSELDPRIPKFTHTKDCIIISNFDQIPQFKNFLTCTFVHSEIAEKADHVQFHNNGICIVKKMCHCGCQSCQDRKETFTCDCCGQLISRIEPKPPENKSGCTEAICNRLETAGITFCATKFQEPKCLFGCMGVVYGISDGCKYCCSAGGFYVNCIKPFENILDKCPCVPEHYNDAIW